MLVKKRKGSNRSVQNPDGKSIRIWVLYQFLYQLEGRTLQKWVYD